LPQGRFITFEGGEGAGKSTQVERLRRRLETHGLDVIATREPGGSPHAEQIREGLLSGTAKRFGPFAEALLFSAARMDHLDRTIRPALERGAFVLCDRFADSTRVYQGALGGVGDELLDALDHAVVGDTRPDLTVILDLPAAVGLQRASHRRGDGSADRFESEDESYHDRLRQAFLKIAEQEPDRCIVIDANNDADAVENEIFQIVETRFLKQSLDAAARQVGAGC
jgi:dTMP kinase